MLTLLGALVYAGPDVRRTGGVAEIDDDVLFPSWAALREEVGSNGVVVEFGDRDATRPIRFDLAAAASEAQAEASVEEAVYLVTPTGLDGKPGLLVEELAQLVWSIDPTAVIPEAAGGRAEHAFATSVVVTDSGLAVCRSGVALRSHDATPATVTVYDPGRVAGIVRMFSVTDAAAAAGLLRRWL